MRCVSVVILTVAGLSSFICVQGLECSLDSRSNQRELQKIVETCMHKDSENEGKQTEVYVDDLDEDATEASTQGYKSGTTRFKRNDNYTQESHPDNGDMDANNTNSNKENCVIHCILTHFGMVEGGGYPEYQRVLQILLKKASNRELRDFVQETTNECFQLMAQGEKQEPCDFSTTLVKCLAERGKANCADWPIGNLEFLD